MKEGKGDRFQVASNSNGVNAAMVRSAGPEAGTPTETWEAGAGGQRRVGTWVILSKGGRAVGKRTGSAHIAPDTTRLGLDNSSQVVDFPHLSAVRVFWEALKSGKMKDWHLEETRNGRKPAGRGAKEKAIISTHQDTLIFTLATPL